MNAELFFIFDSHCPWSYATTAVVNEISQAFPNIKVNCWHISYFDGESAVTKQQIENVEKMSNATFSAAYKEALIFNKDSTLVANLMAWCEQKNARASLPLLNALQTLHFQQGNALTTASDVENILTELKLSPPNKAMTCEKLTKDAEYIIHEIFAMQEIINTKAIPALLLANEDNLTLLDHSLYLQQAALIIPSIKKLLA